MDIESALRKAGAGLLIQGNYDPANNLEQAIHIADWFRYQIKPCGSLMWSVGWCCSPGGWNPKYAFIEADTLSQAIVDCFMNQYGDE